MRQAKANVKRSPNGQGLSGKSDSLPRRLRDGVVSSASRDGHYDACR